MLKGLSTGYFLFYFFILLFKSNSLFAFSYTNDTKPKSNLVDNSKTQVTSLKKKLNVAKPHPIVTFTVGASISELGQSESFAPLDLCSYHYKRNNSYSTNVLWGGFIGSKVIRSSSWEFIAGLGYYQPNFLYTKGQLTQGADAESSETYDYKYRTQSQQFLAEGKLYWITKKKIEPFLMLGVGVAYNNISNYQTNVPSFLEFTPEFSNHTHTTFTYALGPGIDISLSKSYKIGVVYRFTNLGSADTGSAQLNAIPISNTLKQSHLYANQILAQITFIS